MANNRPKLSFLGAWILAVVCFAFSRIYEDKAIQLTPSVIVPLKQQLLRQFDLEAFP